MFLDILKLCMTQLMFSSFFAEIFLGGHGDRPCAQLDRPHGQQPSSHCLQTGGVDDDMGDEMHSLPRSFYLVGVAFMPTLSKFLKQFIETHKITALL